MYYIAAKYKDQEIRIPKERILQFCRQEAAGRAGIPLDQFICHIYFQTDINGYPLDVIVDYRERLNVPT